MKKNEKGFVLVFIMAVIAALSIMTSAMYFYYDNDLKSVSPVINKDIFGFLNIEGSVGSKKTAGGTALEEVEKQIKKAKDIIKEYEQDL